MRLPRGSNALLAVLLLLLVVGLAVLAVLQYRWIDRVTDAERQRMRANIDFSARHFVADLQTEIEQIFRTFGSPEGGDLAERYMEWMQSATDPELIAGIYLLQPEEGMTLRRFDFETMELSDTPWPASFADIHHHLERQRSAGRRMPPPFFSDPPLIFIGPRRGPPRGLFSDDPLEEEPRVATLIEIDRARLVNTTLPRLANRHFSVARDTYAVAVLHGANVVYRSEASWPDGRAKPDLDMEFVPVDPRMRERPRPHKERPGEDDMGPRKESMVPWRLLVRRQDGGLDGLVASARRRNLAVSFGVLLILAVTAMLLVALVRRAESLRMQQTQFVAAITHELNTPIAALLSAGENLEAGIVADRDKLARYGRTIVKEATRLGDMVAQVLEFAGLQARAVRRPHEPVDVAEILDEAVAQCRWLVDGTVIDVQTEIDPGLPPVRGDAEALTRAVQNLLANAIRHGGAGMWVGLRASRDRKGNVAITVEDRGPGIASDDLSHLFEPFYRGRGSGRTRGTGLGLTIVQQIAAAHGGSIEVDSGRRAGAAFTLILPAVAHA